MKRIKEYFRKRKEHKAQKDAEYNYFMSKVRELENLNNGFVDNG